jgi:2,3-bisphosphoglycerate-dependent phosphoglycerate mutase
MGNVGKVRGEFELDVVSLLLYHTGCSLLYPLMARSKRRRKPADQERKDTMTRLYLIRHGQALTEVDGIMKDYGLTPLGVKQAERLRDRLAGSGEVAADVLIASTFLRARQTAEVIAPALDLPIIFDDEVQELRPGSLSGMHVDEYKTLRAARDADFYLDPFARLVPDEENWAQFVLRIGTAMRRIIDQYEGKTVVIVCHGGVIDATFTYFFGLDSLHPARVRLYTHNTSITHWRKVADDADHGQLAWRLVFYNDDLHVRDLDNSTPIPWESLRPGIVS